MPTNTGNFSDSASQEPENNLGADLKDKASRGMQQLADKAETTVRSRIDAGRKEAALTLSSVATTLLQSGLQLKDERQNMAGDYVERAAKSIDRAAHYVERADVGEMVDNLESFARRRPAIFVGAAFALGILGARFIKSSRKNLDGARQPGGARYIDREVPTYRAVEGAGSTTGALSGSTTGAL